MLARSNYEVQFQPEQQLSERIFFPATPSQRNGIEDARFVRFLAVHKFRTHPWWRHLKHADAAVSNRKRCDNA